MNARSRRFDIRHQRHADAGSELSARKAAGTLRVPSQSSDTAKSTLAVPSRTVNPNFIPLAIASTIILLTFSGCRSKAYRDVYQQKMIGEIRNLEDQLYEADYQNRILIDELARAKSQVVVPDAKRSRPAVESPPRSTPMPPRRNEPLRDLPQSDDSTLTPVPLEPEQSLPTLPARPTPDQSPAELTPPPISRPRTNREQNIEPPMVPIPPGAEMEFPDVDLGEPVPPSGTNAVPELPPGRIELPQSTRRNVRVEPAVPVAIRINPSMSGGYRFDDAEDKTGMHLTIEAIDEKGDPVNVEDFDVTGQLTIVLLDPSRSASEARLGRWEYDADEMRQMIRSGPGSAIHVYVPWQDKRPNTKQVIAHVKITGDEAQMQAQAELNTAEVNVAQWNPRGVQMK